MRAGLTQAQLADRLGSPRPQIARWEAEDVEPALSTVRRVLQACGFDLHLSLHPHRPDPVLEQQLKDLQRTTPERRLRRLLDRVEAGEPDQ